MKELNHHDSDPKSHSCSWLHFLAETQFLLFWPFMAQPLIRVLFLSLCLVFWPCLTSRNPVLLPYLGVKRHPRALRCLCCVILTLTLCPGPSYLGPGPWPVTLTSPLSNMSGLLSSPRCAGCWDTITNTCAFWSWCLRFLPLILARLFFIMR